MQDQDWLCGRLADRRVVQTQFGHHLSSVKAEVPGDPRAFLGRRIVLRRGRERDQRQNHHTYCSVGKNVPDFHAVLPPLGYCSRPSGSFFHLQLDLQGGGSVPQPGGERKTNSQQRGIASLKIQQIRCLAQFRAGSRARPRLGRGVGIDWGRAGPPVRQTALVRTKHGFEKSKSTPRKKTAMLNFAFAYSPSSARRRLFKMALRLLMADMVRSISG